MRTGTAASLLALAALAAREFQRQPAGRTTAPLAAEPAGPDEAPDFFAGIDYMGTVASRVGRAPRVGARVP